jgi:hypothetical protein
MGAIVNEEGTDNHLTQSSAEVFTLPIFLSRVSSSSFTADRSGIEKFMVTVGREMTISKE